MFIMGWPVRLLSNKIRSIHINDWNFVYDSISDPTSTRISITTYTVTDTYSRCIAEYRCSTTCTLSLCLPCYDLMFSQVASFIPRHKSHQRRVATLWASNGSSWCAPGMSVSYNPTGLWLASTCVSVHDVLSTGTRAAQIQPQERYKLATWFLLQLEPSR